MDNYFKTQVLLCTAVLHLQVFWKRCSSRKLQCQLPQSAITLGRHAQLFALTDTFSLLIHKYE